jgi:hypothetical protein
LGRRSRQRPPRRSSEERNAEIRAELEPLKPGERPRPLVIGAVGAVAVGIANVIAYAAGAKVQGGEQPALGGVLAFSLLMFVAAWGLWNARYWAVLGVQALLALIVIVVSLKLLVASSLLGALVALLIIVACGWLFWKLVRVMARIQMPSREPHT